MRAAHRSFAPEVVQTSVMDCGPATLKCLLEGFYISASYGRLREACQTDVDGTSIDTLEEVARQLGLEAEQVMVPADHLLLAEAELLPAIVVIRLASGFTHFVVVWRNHNDRLVQVMDPASGRRWPSVRQFLNELYIHTFPVPAAGWREWAGSDEFLRPLRYRLARLGLGGSEIGRLVDGACADSGWQSLAALDAATRLTQSLVRSGGISRGSQAGRVLVSFFEQAASSLSPNPSSSEGEEKTAIIPDAYWSVQPIPDQINDEESMLALRGVVLVRVRGRLMVADEAQPFSPELVAALAEKPARPLQELFHYLRMDGLFTPAMFAAAWLPATLGVVVEAILFRGLIDAGRRLNLVEQRLGAMTLILLFLMANLMIQLRIAAGVMRVGRFLEARLRMAFLQKLPRLNDRYFQSRPISDMADRSHNAHRLRFLPGLATELPRWILTLLLTVGGIIWISPASAPIALLAAAVFLALPLGFQPVLTEHDMRVRTHQGALGRFYLDSLLGLVAVRTHGADKAIRREHESLLREWARTILQFYGAAVVIEGAQFLLGFLLAAWLLLDYLAQGGSITNTLLLVYWTLNLPTIAQELVLTIRQYPLHRNVTLRLLEPLGAPEEKEIVTAENAEGAEKREKEGEREKEQQGVCVRMEEVGVQLAGHRVLEGINLDVAAGTHLAIIGPSGAGKSSLVGLLLGWHRPASGRLWVDGFPLSAGQLAQLRQQTAWVDPAVQLWNRSVLDNLYYGSTTSANLPLLQVIEQADLRRVLGSLPAGLQTALGESGGLVSGGEGQRIRLGRAMLRPAVRLVILDEPFRGLGRQQRHELLQRARQLWAGATLLCITHDVSETADFDRVAVMENGCIVEAGVPAELGQRPDSRYRAMLDAETAVRQATWSAEQWRKLKLQDGVLTEEYLSDQVTR
jgi:ABC-type bacteriocin/lantibiotic exporter with double-glycine peptidase domain